MSALPRSAQPVDATGMNTMSETASVAKYPARPRPRKPATVSASALALHLDCSRTYIAKLEAEGVIQRQGDGFPLDQSRVAYLRYLRRERLRSPRAAADAEHAAAKAALLRLRVARMQKRLMPVDEAVAHMDAMVGLLLTRLSGFAAQCGGRDLAARRVIDKAVYDLRTEISKAATKLADQSGEPPDNAEP
jgi:hypothetical protein